MNADHREPNDTGRAAALRVVTWNTWWCFGPWEERRPLLLAALAQQQPDVVLLQETWPGQAEAAAQACGLEVIALAVGPFHPTSTEGTVAGHEFGNAVLGRPDQARVLGTLPLASPEDRAPRNGVAVAWEHGGGAVAVVATHLNHIASSSDVRQRQLDHLTDWIGGLWPIGPVVLGGDLNLTPYSPEYRQGIEPRWVDLWPLAHPDDPGSTMVPANPRFRDLGWMDERNGPGRPPGVRFDYLLARRGPDGPIGLTVSAMDVVGDARHGWPSDHLGLVMDLCLTTDDRPAPQGA